MKKFSFLSVIYYGFAVIIGLALAFYFFAYGSQMKVADTMKARAEAGDTLGVTRLITGFQNDDAIYDSELSDGSHLAIYEVVTTYTTENNDGNKKVLIEQGYMGILLNPTDEWNRKDYTNADGLKFNKFGVSFDYIKNDGTIDSYLYRIGYMENDPTLDESEATIVQNRFYSYQTCGFYYFQFGKHSFEALNAKTLNKLTLTNSNGEASSISLDLSNLNLSLNYDEATTSKFMKETSPFINTYNEKVLDNANDNDLNKLTQEFVENDYSFGKSDSADVTKNVTLFNVLKILGYAAIILIIGDTLVGKHLIIIFFMRLFGKKSNAPRANEASEYMTDYEVNTTISASVPVNYSKTITIKYISETNDEIVFDLKKSEGYSKTLRIHNGQYSHPEIIAEGLTCADIPSLLNVRGLTYKVKFEFAAKDTAINAEIVEK
ncbi:MAG: hypothetical protein K6G28_02595 [Acholeplasmatales bacterium]|nr:hypothetical protein [Acholeplasmatales bacterium]